MTEGRHRHLGNREPGLKKIDKCFKQQNHSSNSPKLRSSVNVALIEGIVYSAIRLAVEGDT